MSILSIDVGMKHLAYCVINQNDDDYEIQDWNIINLCSENEYPKCMESSKKKCNKPSKYFKNGCYYCKLHAKKRDFLIPPSNLKEKNLKKIKTHELKSIALEKKYEMAKNSKKQDYINKIKEDLSNNYFNIIEPIDSRDINIVTFGKRIKTCFNDIVDKYNIDCLLIENQIGPLALRMKMIQGMIMQHFIEIDCHTIKEISPSNKLKMFTKDTKKTSYIERKKKGIDVTRKLLQDNSLLMKWCDYFEKHKKKDDLADSFLQALWYIKQ
tara:strand:- start:1089 stop:1892 length:804 start_codon:yes stop_codon:yes gene_type:complete